MNYAMVIDQCDIALFYFRLCIVQLISGTLCTVLGIVLLAYFCLYDDDVASTGYLMWIGTLVSLTSLSAQIPKCMNLVAQTNYMRVFWSIIGLTLEAPTIKPLSPSPQIPFVFESEHLD